MLFLDNISYGRDRDHFPRASNYNECASRVSFTWARWSPRIFLRHDNLSRIRAAAVKLFSGLESLITMVAKL